jgi:hypothetical protein
MKVKFVPKSEITISRKSSSKYQDLIDAAKKLESGGKALQVKYRDQRELSSMRNIIYSLNKESDNAIRSNKDAKNRIIYFYRE